MRTWAILLILIFIISVVLTIDYLYHDSISYGILTPASTSVFLINMKHNVDRRKFFNAQYQSSDIRIIPYTTFEAINGKQLRIQEYTSRKAYQEILQAEQSGYRTKHYQLTRGAIGCYLSHMEIYRRVVAGDKPFAIIFEDDVEIPRTVLRDIHRALDKIPSDWDMFLLGCFCIVCNKTQHFSQIQRFFLMHAYVVTKEGAKKLLNYLEKIPIEQQVDAAISKLAEKQGINIYCANAHIAQQNNRFNTTIQLPMKRIQGVNPYAKE